MSDKQLHTQELARIRPPGSKSMTLRALLLGALRPESTMILHAGDSADVRAMRQALQALGVAISTQGETTRVQGRIHDSGTDSPIVVAVGESGAAFRFLLGVLSALPGRYELTGLPGLMHRPIGPLVDALRARGANIEYAGLAGYAPLRIFGGRLSALPAGFRPDSEESGQFVSALLFSGIAGDTPLEFSASAASLPYVDMTLAMMRQAGYDARRDGDRYCVSPVAASGTVTLTVEPDASGASYFLAAAAISGQEAQIFGLTRDSLQGDIRMADFLRSMGAHVDMTDPGGIRVRGRELRGITADLRDTPDIAPTLAVTAACAAGPSRLSGLRTLRVKESDRLQAVAGELVKCGVHIRVDGDAWAIEPGPLRPAMLACYNDHRLAMSFSLLRLREPGIHIDNPGCVAKSYPGFFDDWAAVLRQWHISLD